MPRILLLTLCSLLAACGGGGGSDPGAEPETSAAASSDDTGSSAEAAASGAGGSDAQVQSPTSVTQMSDLVVDEGFLFTSSFPINISIDVADSQPQVDYVTVCLPSAATPEQPDMNNCLVRSALENGRLVRDAQVTGDTTRLFAVFWDFAEPNAPVTRSFAVSPTSNRIDLQ